MKRDWIARILGPGEHQMLLDFFVAYSRFEYALTRAGYYKKHEGKKAKPKKPKFPEPDWETFGDSIVGKFATSKDKLFKLACQYLMDQPQSSPVIREGVFEWKTTARLESEPDEKFVLRLVRKIRNNLFRGGTPSETGTTDDPARNHHLLQASLTVLHGCLKCNDELKEAFESVQLP